MTNTRDDWGYAVRIPSDVPGEAQFLMPESNDVLAGNADDLCGECHTPAIALDFRGRPAHFVHDADCPSDDAVVRRREERKLEIDRARHRHWERLREEGERRLQDQREAERQQYLAEIGVPA